MRIENAHLDSDALGADLALLESILWARSAVPDRLVEFSASRDAEVLDLLRVEPMYQFAEFFFLLHARRITEVAQVARLADLHNAHVAALTRDAAKMRRLGLRTERLLDAILTADVLPRLLQTWRERPGTLDQSNLGRLLATMMSTETCRKLVVAAAAAGFLERIRSPYGTVLVHSTGAMERVFGGVMRELRGRIGNVSA